MSQPKQKTCLSRTELEKYLNEHISEHEEADLQQHIGGCTHCQEQLEQLAASRAMWDGLRDSIPSDSATTEVVDTTVNNLIDHLAPTEDPKFLGRLGAYEVCGIIGQGSTGIVLKAFEPRLNRYVAIKVLSPTLASNGSARKRFEREGRAIASVSHEHVVPIYAVDDYRGLPYIVMQYIPGVSLLQRIKKSGSLNTCEVVRIGLQVARGLDAAHRQGIVHRDVKPANVILEDTIDRAMVTDFGLARVADEGTMTRTGTISGTPQYMSPEQARGEFIDARTDLFSLGSLMYTACTARPPFRAETVFGIIHRVCETEPRTIQEINPDIAPWLVQFIRKLMAKEPNDRFESAAQVAELLECELAHLQNPSSSQVPNREWLRTLAPERRIEKSNWSARYLATAAIFAATIFGGYIAWQNFDPQFFAIAAGEKENNPDSASDPTKPDDPDIALSATSPSERGARNNASSANTPNPSVNTQVATTNSPKDPTSGNTENDANATTINVVSTTSPGEAPKVIWERINDSSNALQQTFVQRVDQSFAIETDATISLTAEHGDIEVQQTELDYASFVIISHINAANRAEAEKIATYHQATSQSDDGVTIETSLDESFKERGGKDRFDRIVYGLAVPVGTHVNVNAKDGRILVGSLTGNVSAVAKSGDVRFGKIRGDIWARSTGGEIVANQGCTGDADCFATHGNICAAGIEQKGRLRSSDGNIYVGENPGKIYAHSTGGDVRIASIKGPISGHVEVGDLHLLATAPPESDCDLSVNSGDIHVKLPEDSAVSINARGEIESVVESEWRSDSTADDNSDTAANFWRKLTLKPGGPTMTLAASTGKIVLDTEPAIEKKNSPGESGNDYFSLGGSGSHSVRKKASQKAIEKTTGEPRPGAMVPIEIADGENIDGYTLYLPISYDGTKDYPVILYLSGGYSVGGPITNNNDWGLPRLLRDEDDLESERNQLLLDSFIVISPHIQDGDYDDHPDVISRILNEVANNFRTDKERVYLTGLSRGGHASWNIIPKLPATFAATVPVGGRPDLSNFDDFVKVAVWVSHNKGDQIADWEGADAAAKSIEKTIDEKFERFDVSVPSDEQLQSKRYVFCQPDIASHDAWTDLYCSAEFYRWLLAQKRE